MQLLYWLQSMNMEKLPTYETPECYNVKNHGRYGQTVDVDLVNTASTKKQ